MPTGDHCKGFGGACAVHQHTSASRMTILILINLMSQCESSMASVRLPEVLHSFTKLVLRGHATTMAMLKPKTRTIITILSFMSLHGRLEAPVPASPPGLFLGVNLTRYASLWNHASHGQVARGTSEACTDAHNKGTRST